MVSASVRNGFNQSGAPSGSKAATKALVFLMIDLMIIVSQRGRPNARVNIKWLDVGRRYGIRPDQFVRIRKINNGVIIDDIPLIDFPMVRFIWSFIRVNGAVSIEERRVGVSHREDVIIAMGIRFINQASWVFSV